MTRGPEERRFEKVRPSSSLRTYGVHAFSPRPPCHLFVRERVQQVSIEGRAADDDPASREIDPRGEGGGRGQDFNGALTKGSLQHVAFIKRQTCRDQLHLIRTTTGTKKIKITKKDIWPQLV